ncbi:TRAP transporter substrate-binding protein [Mediterraneibacter gnavus]|uniref:TRAP transporter substrate-binding protein n=1 Tax=Mediterraneibacter gnavus TaxID=33038 RepID=UPI00232EB79E|nr:TRAP transporter substrate-binding protein [Mediterraneibacter gnavus]MDB8711777.1 TRAP transporter substrate-binding protein [Mediterraneibacter gnavus]MDB8714778.1 TRAP transporter substrate-binding protein [Mediterraneibacter gnavus]
MKKLHIAGVMLILMISLGLLSGCETTEEKTQIIRVAFNQPESHPEYKALEDFGEKFKEATNGRYEVEIYPNAVLGDQGAVTEMVRTGAIQLAVVPMSVPESYNSDFAIIAAPYLYDNLEQMETAAREGVFDPLFTTTSKYNFEIVSLYTSGARHIYTDKPIVTPEDLKGYKIRVQDSDAYIQMIDLMGGVGIPMAQSEVYAAVQQHVIEGGENSEVVYNNFKHYEVSPYFSYTNHLVMTDVVAASEKFLDSMDKETREIFDKLIKESMEVEFEEWDKAIEEANEILEEKGVTFVEADVDAFREKCAPLLESIANRSEMTRQIYDDVMEIKEREEKTQ